MKCSKFRKIAVPLLMETGGDEELALALARRDTRLREHMDLCEACRSYLLSCRAALGRLGQVEIVQPGEREWAKALDAIHGAVRQKAPAYRVVWGDLHSVSWARVGAVAAVALLLFITSIAYFRPQPAVEEYLPALRVASVQPAGEVSLAFLEEMELEDRECNDIISEIDGLMDEIETACAQVDMGTGEISLEYGISDDILT